TLAQHGVGSAALGTFFILCNIVWIECVEGGGKATFIHFFKCLNDLKLKFNVLAFKLIDVEYEKLFSLLAKNVDYLILTRDPFEVWTCYSNHRIRNYSVGELINSNDDLHVALDMFLYVSTWSDKPLFPCINDKNTWMQLKKYQIPRGCVFETSIINYISNGKNFFYIQTEDLNEEKAFDTIKSISKIFSFKIPDNPLLFRQKVMSNINIFFPRKIIFDEKNILITVQTIYSSYDNNIFTDIKKEVYPKDGVFFDEIVVLIENSNIHYIDDITIEQFAKYFKKFAFAIEERIAIEKQKKINVDDNLYVFKKHSKIRDELREIFNIEFKFIKQHRPDIVASWKYYQEFEKMCEELDEKEDSLKENISNN
ncbi:DUF2972 domain-containing protein, partial [Campylobacter insulaenigrae]|uniref:DUF2972 domain-containing protein n=1 Tax=Campylobacter insulaenigrae TaxID=260714 RepID=UPI0021521E7E